MSNNKQARTEYAEKMLALATFLSDGLMTQGDINRAVDCMIMAYDVTAKELPALAGYAKVRLTGKYLNRKEFDVAVRDLQKHMQKWINL